MGLFEKMFAGLSKTRNNMEELEALFQNYKPDSKTFYNDLEELLVLADVGAATAARVCYEMERMKGGATSFHNFNLGYTPQIITYKEADSNA